MSSGVGLRVALPANVAFAAPQGTGGADDGGAPASVVPPREEPPVQGDPLPPVESDVVTLPDGRQYRRRVDPATGHLLYEHNSQQTAANGNRLTLSIVIDIAPDGTASKTTDQRLDLPNGAFSQDRTVTSYDAQFTPLSEVSDFRSVQPGKEQTERTVATYANGQVVKRTTDFRQVETAGTPGGEQVWGENVITAVWDGNGQPVTDATVPSVDRKETVKYTTPGGGINKDTPRTITTFRHGVGTLQQMTWPRPMVLTVRFDGRDGQYIERELSVPMDAAGNPKLSEAEVVRTTDNQKGHVKALMQARIWGGFTSQIMAIIGSRMLNGSLGSVGRMLLWGGVAAGGAEVVGETHAIIDKRNDASIARLAMGIYDTTWMGLYAYYRGRQGRDFNRQLGNTPFTINDGMTGLGVLGASIHGAELLAQRPESELAFNATSLQSALDVFGADSLRLPRIGSTGAGSLIPADWRAEQRFDPAAVLAPQLDIAAV